MEIRDQECLSLQAKNQVMVEEHQVMAEELALARRALEDEHQARAAELRTMRQTTEDAHAQSVAVATELEQTRQEWDELHGGLQTATQECDTAIRKRDTAVQKRDTAVASAGEASKREKTTLASLQGTLPIFLPLVRSVT
jgi:DNA repair exonuclease SbcCD ATPase subunit